MAKGDPTDSTDDPKVASPNVPEALRGVRVAAAEDDDPTEEADSAIQAQQLEHLQSELADADVQVDAPGAGEPDDPTGGMLSSPLAGFEDRFQRGAPVDGGLFEQADDSEEGDPTPKYGRDMISGESGGTTWGVGYGIPTTGEGEVTNSPASSFFGEIQGYAQYEKEMTEKADEVYQQRHGSAGSGGSSSGSSGSSGSGTVSGPTTTYDGDEVTTTYADGTVVVTSPDGQAVIHPDGSMDIYDKDGNLVRHEPPPPAGDPPPPPAGEREPDEDEKEDPPKDDEPKEDPPKDDEPKEDPPKEDPPKEDPPKEEPPAGEEPGGGPSTTPIDEPPPLPAHIQEQLNASLAEMRAHQLAGGGGDGVTDPPREADPTGATSGVAVDPSAVDPKLKYLVDPPDPEDRNYGRDTSEPLPGSGDIDPAPDADPGAPQTSGPTERDTSGRSIEADLSPDEPVGEPAPDTDPTSAFDATGGLAAPAELPDPSLPDDPLDPVFGSTDGLGIPPELPAPALPDDPLDF